jgi:hypothetical protein
MASDNPIPLPEILADLELHPNDTERVHRNCVRVGQLIIRSIEEDEAFRSSLVDLDGIRIMINVMRDHQNDILLQRYCSNVLRFLACREKQNQVEIAKHGAVPLIVRAMVAWPDNRSVQYSGCTMLRALAQEVNENRILIAEEKGIEAIVAALHTHKGYADLELYGCEALFLLATNEKNRAIMAKAGAVEALVGVIESEQDSDGRRQRMGLGALGFIAFNDDCIAKIAKASIVKTIIATMKRYQEDYLVQLSGCGLFIKLVLFGNVEIRKVIIQAGGIEATIASMKLHQQDENADMQEISVLAIACLAKDDRRVVELVNQLGGIEAICAARDAHSGNENMKRIFHNVLFILMRSSVDQLLLNERPTKRDRESSFDSLDDRRNKCPRSV